MPLYKALLHATSVTCVEDTAKIAGIDLTDKAFWRQGLQSLASFFMVEFLISLAQSR